MSISRKPGSRIWLEKTSLDHGHDGVDTEWAFQRALWSPTKQKDGVDGYALMREVRAGDLILHVLKKSKDGSSRRLAGYSYAAGPAQTIDEQPPSPGDWANQSPYYRIPVSGFQPFSPILELDRFFAEFKAQLSVIHENYDKLFFSKKPHSNGFQLSQGMYLTEVPIELFDLFLTALDRRPAIDVPAIPRAIVDKLADEKSLNYSELAWLDELARTKGDEAALQAIRDENRDKTPEQIQKALVAYKRNRKLVELMKKKHGYKCQIENCRFTFKKKAGGYYAEAAHILEISSGAKGVEVPENILILCANYHKMFDYGEREMISKSEVKLNGETYLLMSH